MFNLKAQSNKGLPRIMLGDMHQIALDANVFDFALKVSQPGCNALKVV